MEWIEARISTTPEGVEPVFGVLMSCGVTGIQIVDDYDMACFLKNNPLAWDYVDEAMLSPLNEVAIDETVREAQVVFYTATGPAGSEMLKQVCDNIKALPSIVNGINVGSLAINIESVDDECWLNEWKKYYKPFRIGNSVVVCPAWEDYQPQDAEIVFTLDPGSVFGTGLHQTTRLCVEALERFVRRGDAVLDIGCGSGILSIISILLGAGSAYGCDFDPAAEKSVLGNALRNPINPEALTVRTGDIFTNEGIKKDLFGRRFDIVIANIVADVVIRLSSLVSEYLKPGGLWIVSGIIAERKDEVSLALTENGYTLLAITEKDNWFCMAGRLLNHA